MYRGSYEEVTKAEHILCCMLILRFAWCSDAAKSYIDLILRL